MWYKTLNVICCSCFATCDISWPSGKPPEVDFIWIFSLQNLNFCKADALCAWFWKQGTFSIIFQGLKIKRSRSGMKGDKFQWFWCGTELLKSWRCDWHNNIHLFQWNLAIVTLFLLQLSYNPPLPPLELLAWYHIEYGAGRNSYCLLHWEGII